MNRLQKDAQEAAATVLKPVLKTLEAEVKNAIKVMVSEIGVKNVSADLQNALAAVLGSNWAKGRFDIPDIEDLLIALYILGRSLPKITVG